ncbi:MAG: PEP-CTERM sorting domain-containing protein [Rubrivivax sp.]
MKSVMLGLLAALVVPAHAAVVVSNVVGGDIVVTDPVAVGATGWEYGASNGGTVGIQNTYPRSGNGSVRLTTTTSSSYAEMRYSPGGSLGLLSALTGFGYDWYRFSSSTNPDVQAPAMAITVDIDGDPTTDDIGYLIYEPVYNVGGVAMTDVWVTVGGNGGTNLWSAGAFGFVADLDGNGYAYDESLSDWHAAYGNATVTGFVAFMGSGISGFFDGAVDNVSWTFGTANAMTTNFEVRGAGVPEPASLVLVGLGGVLAGLTSLRRRRSRLG